jgi:hypothetical protein
MRKIFLIATLVGVNSLLHATTINAPSSLIGSDSITGEAAYAWGINIGAGVTVTSATISWSDVTFEVAGPVGTPGHIYTDLLDLGTTTLTKYSTTDSDSDYFAGTSITHDNVGLMTFASIGTEISTNITLNAAELSVLNSYLSASNGDFNIGISPDCYYTVGGLSFTYTTTPSGKNTVPDVATTAFLMLMGLVGLEVFRRQFAAARIKG